MNNLGRYFNLFILFLGAEAFISLEYDNEMLLFAEKKDAARRVDDAANYLGGTFWNYVYDKDRYNFTQDKFVNESERDIRTFVQFVVNATRDYSYDGSVEGWEKSWTFPKALLFTITIMATIGTYSYLSRYVLTYVVMI